MTGGRLEVAYWFIQIAASAVLLIVCGLLVGKALNLCGERLLRKGERKHQAYFVRLQTGFDRPGALPKPEGVMKRTDRKVVQARLVAWIDRLDGLARDNLIALCEELGFVERELARLRSRRSMVRTGAAYRLGLMRSKRAAAPLLEQLRKQRFGPALFVFARSLALCARDADDLEKMVMQIVKHRRPVYEMIAAILEEAGGDLRELSARLVRSGNPGAARIALLYLEKRPGMREIGSGNVLVFREPSAGDEQLNHSRMIQSDGRMAK